MLQIGAFQGPKMLQIGDGNYIKLLDRYLKRHIESKHGIVAERDMTGPLCGEGFCKCKNFGKAYENTFEV